MKDARDFIELEDWANAAEKLELEIKNNPKSLEAYKLLLLSNRQRHFPDYDENKFLDPQAVTQNDFPALAKEKADELFKLMDRINRIDASALTVNDLFFKALYRSYEWAAARSLTKSRCENESYEEAIALFKKCSEMKSYISDNSYYWWFRMQCDTTFTIAAFVNNFKAKYPNSDLAPNVVFMDLAEKLKSGIDKFKSKPDSTHAKRVLKYVKPFFVKYPDFEAGHEKINYLIVDHVVENNREYDRESNAYKYTNSSHLLRYLKVFSNTSLNTNLSVKALQSIAALQKNSTEFSEAVATYERILAHDVDAQTKDTICGEIASAYQDQKKYKEAIEYYARISQLSDMQKYDLWQCYVERKQTVEAEQLATELKNSSNTTVKYLFDLSSQLNELQNLPISRLDAKFDSYSVKITGYVTNRLSQTVYNVKVTAQATDQYGNNAKQSQDYIDFIKPGRKSYFEITLYYGSNVPSRIKYGAQVVDYSKR